MSHSTWSIADAKSKLSEVLNRAEREAQIITRRNNTFVVLNGEEYDRLQGRMPSLQQLILHGPNLDGVNLQRDRSPGRELEM